VCVFLRLCTVRGLTTSWSPVQEVLPTVLDLVTEMKRKVSWRWPRAEFGCRAKGKKCYTTSIILRTFEHLSWFAQLYRGRNRDICEAVTGIVEHRKRCGQSGWRGVIECSKKFCVQYTRMNCESKHWNWISYARICCSFSFSTRDNTFKKCSYFRSKYFISLY
jgi:hypothetical protein